MTSYSDVVAARAPLEAQNTYPVGPDERCDRCGGKGAYRVVLKSGDLVFCATHHSVHAAKLAQVVPVPSSL